MTLVFDHEQATAYLAALGVPNGGVVDWRAIHDTDKTIAAIPFRDALDSAASSLERYNNAGYGIFAVVNELDGVGRELANIVGIRANMIDYDGEAGSKVWADATWQQYQAVNRWELPPTFTVCAAVAGKFHAYWTIRPDAEPLVAIAGYELTQRKLVAKWNSDPAVIDATRVMRLPGSWHLKNPANPVQVVMYPGSGLAYARGAVEWALMTVTAAEAGGDRRALDDPALSAPSLEWAVYALGRIDPDELPRIEWLKLSSAFKSSVARHCDASVARMLWDQWCAKYDKNDAAENAKLWGSIHNSAAGWNALATRAGVKADVMFAGTADSASARLASAMPGRSAATGAAGVPLPPAPGSEPAGNGLDRSSFLLSPEEQVDYFGGCVLIASQGSILTPSGRFMDASKFNALYGGKAFVVDGNGKTTGEAWAAATRGQIFRIPKVDHTRFLPTMPTGSIFTDDLGRKGVNTYIPAIIDAVEGDASPFVNHLRKILATEQDLRIFLSYLAHCVQRPGVKAFWAPLIQSTEGGGKGIVKEAMQHAIGSIYVHAPNTQELAEGGAKFNAWLRNKLLIIADEIRVDEKRDMLEALKPLISESRLEIQGKGADQQVEDNPANWIMFTNYKDAIPITKDGRRYSIFYSTIQSVDDLAANGMSGDYFPKLYAWLRGDGKKHVAWFLKSYPIEAEFDPAGLAHRAPVTSSTAEAIVMSRGRVEQSIMQAVSDGLPGFRNGWLSSSAVARALREENIRVGPHTLAKAFEGLGYHFIGRAGRAFFQEDSKQPNLYALDKSAIAGNYPIDQGYGNTQIT